ncbi:MAG: insulinase family protein [Solobacterium sp.]|nr:insulinase family protein [Solobacterium sp.]
MMETFSAEGRHIHIHSLSKFKTNTIVVSFLWPLRTENTPASYLLSYLLADSCMKYPTKQAVLRQLDHLYGASLNITNEPFGCADRLRFSISGIESFDHSTRQLEEMMDMLAEFIFRPRFEQGAFADSVFHECMDQAMIGIQECLDDPFFLCAETASRNYGGAISRRVLPEISALKTLTPQSCAEFWSYVLTHARIDIQVLGNVDVETTRRLVREKFPFKPRSIRVPISDVMHGNDREVVIEKDIPQSHIVMLFETACHAGDEDMPALLLGNGVFGSLPVSLLFQKVREEKGLCYSIDSRVMPFDGILRVSAAGRREAIDEIRTSILSLIEDMKQGKFEAELLEAARKMTVNSVRSAQDIADALLVAYYRRALVPTTPDFDALTKRYQAVKKEDIQKRFAALTLRTVAIVQQGGIADETE